MKRTNLLLPICGTPLLAAALLLLPLSCQQERDPNLDAAPLLQEARERLTDGDFAASHALLDSMRRTYPKAFRVRREALGFEDSLRIEEAISERFAKEQEAKEAAQALADWERAHPDHSFLDADYRQLRNRADTLAMEHDRLMKKVDFYVRQAQERRKAAE